MKNLILSSQKSKFIKRKTNLPRILFLGDIFAKAGRQVVINKLPQLIHKGKIDFTIANAENSAHGFGMTKKIVASLYEAGVDIITSGNHAFDNADIMDVMATDERLLRPHNWMDETLPGSGIGFVEKKGCKLMVVNLAGQVFMKEAAQNPFHALDRILGGYPLKQAADIIFVDVHAEVTSEKQALGHYADGRVSMLVGTHVHIPTADTRILEKGTAYQTDAGMCGVYDSVIGTKKENSINRLRETGQKMPFSPAEGEATLCAVIADIDENTGLAQRVSPIRLGGDLSEILPAWL